MADLNDLSRPVTTDTEPNVLDTLRAHIVRATTWSGWGSTANKVAGMMSAVTAAVSGGRSMRLYRRNDANTADEEIISLPGVSVGGSAATATTAGSATTAIALSSGASDWASAGVGNNVVGMLGWKNYGNNHVIFDASNSTSPSGGAVNGINPVLPWIVAYPTLMGWNGSVTHGVRVDTARIAESITAGASGPLVLGQCRLKYVSASQIRLDPEDGNLLRVNGVACTVPDAGVTLASTGLLATTLYYIYAVATAGVITSLEASTTVRLASTTAGNKGVQIKTGDDTRTLVGLVYVGTAATFEDTLNKMFVRSWFNHSGKVLKGSFGTLPISGSAGTFFDIAQTSVQFVAVSGDGATATSAANGVSTVLGETSVCGISLDGVPSQNAAFATAAIVSKIWNLSMGMTFPNLTEGHHTLVLQGQSQTGGFVSVSGQMGVTLTTQGI